MNETSTHQKTQASSLAEQEFILDDGRAQQIVRTSVVGILANVALAVFKALVGVWSASIAITMDAVNNLSDAASSLITIVGTRLAAREPDRKHPFGYGRIEYLSAMLIAILVLYAGLTSLVESVKTILAPATPDYTPITLIIVTVAVLVKIVLGRYVSAVGKRVNSASLENSGQDATLDAIISTATLVAAGIFIGTGISLEAWLAAGISLFIVKSGVDMLRDTLSQILGERASVELAQAIKKTVCSFDGVSGAYDLVLHNYGPDTYSGSVHIEIPDTYTAEEIDELIRKISVKVYHEHHVILTAVGVYSLNTHDDEIARVREDVRARALAHKDVLQMHGFFMNKTAKTMRFDLVIGFDAGDRSALWHKVVSEVQAAYPDYTLQVTMDTDFSES